LKLISNAGIAFKAGKLVEDLLKGRGMPAAAQLEAAPGLCGPAANEKIE